MKLDELKVIALEEAMLMKKNLLESLFGGYGGDSGCFYDCLSYLSNQYGRRNRMKKGICILYYCTVVTSALVGLWHFFVPWMFQWNDYLPTQYENLIVGIDYTNLCFSLLLFGLSIMLIVLGKRALSLHKEVIYFYYFLTIVWLFRACLATFLEPWPLEPVPAAAIGQLVASDLLALLMIFVSISFIKAVKKK